MNSLMRLPTAVPAPLLVRYGGTLDFYAHNFGRSIDDLTELPPPPVVRALRSELERQLIPLDNPKQAGGAVALLFAQCSRSDFDVNLTMRLFVDRASQYPASVLAAAVDEILGTLKYPKPMLADFVKACEEIILPIRRRLVIVEAMEAEHARRETRAAERAQVERKRRIRIELIESKIRQALDGAELPANVYETANLAFLRSRDTSTRRYAIWMTALEGGETWAAKLVIRLANAAAINEPQLITRAINATFDVRDRANRDDFQCAWEELRLNGASQDEITAWMLAVADKDADAQARQTELAGANRARDAQSSVGNTSHGEGI